MEKRIPSTDQSTWNANFKVGDKVKIRVDFSDRADVNKTYSISSINKEFSSQAKRKENPSGYIYVLSGNGGDWEGKDLELSEENVNISSEKQVFNLPTSFSEYDYETDNLVILRIPPEPTDMPDNPQPQDDSEPKEPQEIPENVENPFDEEKPKDNPDDQKGQDDDQKGKGKDGEDSEGEDSEGEDSEGKDSEKGKDSQGEGEESEDEDSEQGNGKGEDSEGKDNNGDDFGNSADNGLDIEQIMKQIKEDFEKGMSSQDVQNRLDVEVIESALSLQKDQIKEVFKTKELAKTAIGRRNLFGTDNEIKINNALNEIFK